MTDLTTNAATHTSLNDAFSAGNSPHERGPTLRVEPPIALIDIPRTIRLAGFTPDRPVCVEATYTAADGAVWRSLANFHTDGQGALDLADAAPSSGSYEGRDASGLLWSLALETGAATARGDEGIEPRTIELRAIDEAGLSAAATVVQLLVANGVVREEIHADGLVGTVFRVDDGQPRPVVIVLNGSGGGINEARAALFAAHGFVGVALGYFNAPGLPPYISKTPLEYFATALEWVRKTYAPQADFVALAGHSRGAELALLLGATFSAQVSAVIGYVPSHVINGTLRAGAPGEVPTAPAWIHHGVALPTVWEGNVTADWTAFNGKVSPVRQSPTFETALHDVAAVERAAIPVERIAGPVMLVSGTDDGFWPSSDMSEAIVTRLRAAGHRYPVEHCRYEGAGHAIQFPFVPTTRIVRPHAVARIDLTAGGRPDANAHANADSWPRVLAFLHAALAERRPLQES